MFGSNPFLSTTRRAVRMPPVAGLPAAQTLDLPGRGTTRVIDTGRPDGPVLLLLHAVACTGALTWYPSIAPLARRYRLIVPDQRWHGHGIRGGPFSLEDCADDAVAIADALSVSRFTAVGYSMGSLVSQLIWRRHEDRLPGWCCARRPPRCGVPGASGSHWTRSAPP